MNNEECCQECERNERIILNLKKDLETTLKALLESEKIEDKKISYLMMNKHEDLKENILTGRKNKQYFIFENNNVEKIFNSIETLTKNINHN